MMISAIRVLSGALGLLLPATTSAPVGGIYAEYWNGSDWVPVPGFADFDQGQAGLPSGSNVTISGAGINPYRIYAAFPASEDIGDIRIDASSGVQPVYLTVGKFTDSNRYPTTAKRLDIAGARDIGRINSFLGETEIQARAERDFTDWIQSWRVVRLDADGDLLNDVDHDGAGGGPTLGVIQVDEIAAGAAITSFEGDIGTIRTAGNCRGAITAYDGAINGIDIGGNLFADVEASGAILSIDVTGDIGTSTTPRSISSTGESHLIKAANIYATIDTLAGGGSGGFRRIETTSGSFAGSLATQDVCCDSRGDYVTIAGDLDADFSLVWGFIAPVTVGGDLTGTLSLGNGMSADGGSLTVAAGGMVGQVILNADNSGPNPWNGPIKVGSSELLPRPYYNNTGIGGGAVGLVPYYLHYNDCTPTAVKVNEDANTGLDGWSNCNGWHVDEVLLTGQSIGEVTLHHYGPIEREGTGMPVTVKRRALAQLNCTWEDVTDSFTHTMHPGDHKREIRVEGPFDPGYSYRIEPKPDTETSYLYCGGLDAAVGKVALKHYDFVMRVRLIQDITENGLLESDDITAWMAEPVDTTGDGVADEADLIDVTDAVATWGS
jgi:hypothetical protein